MEKELFDWESWDDMGEFMLVFYKVKLKRKIGKFEEGTEFDSAFIDFQKGILELQNEDKDKIKEVLPARYTPMKVEGTFKLSLEVGEEIVGA